MRPAWSVVLAGAITVGVSLSAGVTSVRAQDPGLGGILGGYGAMSSASMGGGYTIVDPSAMGGSVIIPLAGKSGGSMSSSMGGGLSFRSRPAETMFSGRRSFLISSMGGVPEMTGGMGGRRPFTLSTGALSVGMGLGGMQRMSTTSGMGVMPPSFGYPFRQPASLLGSSSTGMGMGM